MNGGEFLEQESMYSIIDCRSAIWYFLLFWVNRCVFLFFLLSSSSSTSFAMLLIHLLLLSLFTTLEFFTSVLPDGFSLEFEWQQVSSSLQDSSQYSFRSQQCCHLDSLYPSANVQVLQAYYYNLNIWGRGRHKIEIWHVASLILNNGKLTRLSNAE